MFVPLAVAWKLCEHMTLTTKDSMSRLAVSFPSAFQAAPRLEEWPDLVRAAIREAHDANRAAVMNMLARCEESRTIAIQDKAPLAPRASHNVDASMNMRYHNLLNLQGFSQAQLKAAHCKFRCGSKCQV